MVATESMGAITMIIADVTGSITGSISMSPTHQHGGGLAFKAFKSDASRVAVRQEARMAPMGHPV
jgi:hypothetical protein